MYRHSIADARMTETKLKSGKRVKHNWTLHDFETRVCTACFLSSYKFSSRFLEEISSKVKMANNLRPTANKVQSFTESSIPDFTLHEIKKIYEENGLVSSDEMIRSTLTPKSNVDQETIAWLDQYFYEYGDSCPDKKLTHLLLNLKSEVYSRYKAERNKLNLDILNDRRFYELWEVLFPYFVKRPWCNIPGILTISDINISIST